MQVKIKTKSGKELSYIEWVKTLTESYVKNFGDAYSYINLVKSIHPSLELDKVNIDNYSSSEGKVRCVVRFIFKKPVPKEQLKSLYNQLRDKIVSVIRKSIPNDYPVSISFESGINTNKSSKEFIMKVSIP